MPHLSQIVNTINTHLKTGALKSSAFQGGMFYGLAKKVFRLNSEGTAVPAIMASDGVGIEVTPDETYPFSIYHKCLNGTFQDDLSKGFGDGHGIKESNQMVAIVYADPQKIKISQEDLAFIIASGMPEQKMKIENTELGTLSYASVAVTGFNNDSYQVFTGEYESSFGLKPQSIYFSLSYRIEITADRNCVICS